MTEEKEHFKALQANMEIDNYNKIYCYRCNREIDIYEDEQSRQRYYELGNVCEECQDN
jgi:hypothetical protein